MLRSLLIPSAAAALSLAAAAQTVPTGYTVDTMISAGLNAPMDFHWLADGRLLIANRAGPVMIWVPGTPASTPPVTIGTIPNVESGGERGLLSVTADPNFATNGYIYVWYSPTIDNFMHLERFTCTGDLSNPTSTNVSFLASSRRVILQSTPDNAFNHNGGSVRFGPDGMLYVTMGEDATTCTAQSTTTSLGCLMRLDVSTVPAGGGTTPPTFSSLDPGNNPLSANTDISQLLIAHGLRNPVRFDIDPPTGNLYIADVGQSAVEEIDELVYPATPSFPLTNFGWPWREGNNTFTSCSGTMPALTAPIATVNQGTGWQAIFMGPRYRNQTAQWDFGANYEGNVFFYDFFAGELRRLVNTGTWVIAPQIPGQPSATNWGVGFLGTTAMRQGTDGAIWFASNPTTSPASGGSIKRIRPLGPTNSVVAISGGGQVVPATEAFAQPLVARVLDTVGNPLPGGTINFAITGPGTLSTTNPVIADGNGFAQTNVTATNVGGAISVTASTPNSPTTGTFSLFSRKLTATPAGSLLVLSVVNTTTAVPPNVPYLVMVSFPGSPTLPTIVGPLCTDPFYALTIVIEDGTGMFNFVSFSGTGGTGTPNKTWLYTLPPGLLTGYLMHFQAIGFDSVTGWFRTNCEPRQF